jgi:hypothetical protein
LANDARRRWLITVAAGVVVLVAAVAYLGVKGKGPTTAAETATTFVRWQAPASGAVAVKYVVRVQEIKGAAEDTFRVDAQPGQQQSFTFTKARPRSEYRACVAGIDSRGRQGPWSGWSPVYRRATAARRS